jgi:hypothetical protein
MRIAQWLEAGGVICTADDVVTVDRRGSRQ